MFRSNESSQHNLHYNMPYKISIAHGLHNFGIQDRSHLPCSVVIRLQPPTTWFLHAHQHAIHTHPTALSTTLLCPPITNTRHNDYPYSAKFSQVFNFVNFVNFQPFVKIFQQNPIIIQVCVAYNMYMHEFTKLILRNVQKFAKNLIQKFNAIQ